MALSCVTLSEAGGTLSGAGSRESGIGRAGWIGNIFIHAVTVAVGWSVGIEARVFVLMGLRWLEGYVGLELVSLFGCERIFVTLGYQRLCVL